MTGNYSIIQNAKTHQSWLRHESNGEVRLIECPKKDFPYLKLLAVLIRNSEDPDALMGSVLKRLAGK